MAIVIMNWSPKRHVEMEETIDSYETGLKPILRLKLNFQTTFLINLELFTSSYR